MAGSNREVKKISEESDFEVLDEEEDDIEVIPDPGTSVTTKKKSRGDKGDTLSEKLLSSQNDDRTAATGGAGKTSWEVLEKDADKVGLVTGAVPKQRRWKTKTAGLSQDETKESPASTTSSQSDSHYSLISRRMLARQEKEKREGDDHVCSGRPAYKARESFLGARDIDKKRVTSTENASEEVPDLLKLAELYYGEEESTDSGPYVLAAEQTARDRNASLRDYGLTDAASSAVEMTAVKAERGSAPVEEVEPQDIDLSAYLPQPLPPHLRSPFEPRTYAMDDNGDEDLQCFLSMREAQLMEDKASALARLYAVILESREERRRDRRRVLEGRMRRRCFEIKYHIDPEEPEDSLSDDEKKEVDKPVLELTQMVTAEARRSCIKSRRLLREAFCELNVARLQLEAAKAEREAARLARRAWHDATLPCYARLFRWLKSVFWPNVSTGRRVESDLMEFPEWEMGIEC